jgi:hypothetical protein
MESTEHITILPADLYDELAADTPTEPCKALQEAARRAREVITRKE